MAAIYTNIGLAKIASATANKTPLLLKAIAISRTQSPLSPEMQSLADEVYRAEIRDLKPDPSSPQKIDAEISVPANQGGWWIYQYGVYDNEGDLIAVGDLPPTFKPINGSEVVIYTLTVSLTVANGESFIFELPADSNKALTIADLNAAGIKLVPDGFQFRNRQGRWVNVSIDDESIMTEIAQEDAAP